MPGELILNSLEIQRLRCFRELRIERLGRVNLIVGKNNVGKSTILDALRLFAKPGSLADLLEIFSTRNEVFPAELDEWSRSHIPSLPVDCLFFGRKAVPGEEGAIGIGPTASPGETLRIILQVSISQAAPVIHSVGPDKDFVQQVFPQLNFGVQSLLFRVGSAAKLILAGIKPLEKIGFVPNTTLSTEPLFVENVERA